MYTCGSTKSIDYKNGNIEIDDYYIRRKIYCIMETIM